MTDSRELGRKVNDRFREFRQYKPQSQIGLIYQVIKAKLDVMSALDGKLSDEEILNAIADAKSSNAVSRAVRYRLRKIRF